MAIFRRQRESDDILSLIESMTKMIHLMIPFKQQVNISTREVLPSKARLQINLTTRKRHLSPNGATHTSPMAYSSIRQQLESDQFDLTT